MQIPSCKHFTGYKPCFPGTTCEKVCERPLPIGTRILLINLDALGNVLATTSILPAIKRRYPESHITWITLKNAAPLLQNNPLLDRVFLWDAESRMIIEAEEFDLVLNVDKSPRSGAFAQRVKAKEKLGFGINRDGVIIPLNPEAEENYMLGLDDHLKFRVNQKTVPQLQCEEFRLPYARDKYILNLGPDEERYCEGYKEEHGISSAELVVGLNTGCSDLYPNKKMTVDQHIGLIERLRKAGGMTLVLLGGPEDTLRNAEIARWAGRTVINTPTTEGVRRGICYENICDLIITGDSFGMHVGIALGKYVVAWFGLSCWTEIDLFDHGRKFIPEGLECSPCCKRTCPYNLECISMVDLDGIVDEVLKYRTRWKRATIGAETRQ